VSEETAEDLALAARRRVVQCLLTMITGADIPGLTVGDTVTVNGKPRRVQTIERTTTPPNPTVMTIGVLPSFEDDDATREEEQRAHDETRAIRTMSGVGADCRSVTRAPG